MQKYLGIVLIVAVCAIALLMGAMRRKAEWLLNMLLRAVLGTIAIYFINIALETAGIPSVVGINAVTVLTCAILGFPGVAALYGFGFFKTL